jgi:hypothetical protein
MTRDATTLETYNTPVGSIVNEAEVNVTLTRNIGLAKRRRHRGRVGECEDCRDRASHRLKVRAGKHLVQLGNGGGDDAERDDSERYQRAAAAAVIFVPAMVTLGFLFAHQATRVAENV